jgi:hypothetical protein
MNCQHCGEPILASDSKSGEATNGRLCNLHTECALRIVAGSVGHQLGLCGCPGNPGIMGDPPGVTKRQAAFAAATLSIASDARKAALKAGILRIHADIFGLQQKQAVN